jgi:proteasome lid subunit RPN8/RPN11
MAVVQSTETESTIIGGIDFARLPRRELKHRLNGPRASAFQVVICQSAINRIHAHGDSLPRTEVSGVLIGDVYRDQTGPFLQVENIIEVASPGGAAAQVPFTAATWQNIQARIDRQFPGCRIVGWYHTHPGHGVFLSKLDVFVHESFFGLPWQTAFIYDPRMGEEGLFGAEDGQSERVAFIVEADEPAAPILAKTNPQQLALMAGQGAAMADAANPPTHRRGAAVGRMLLGVIGLALFAAMGLLLGLLIRLQDIQIPYWIQRMAR